MKRAHNCAGTCKLRAKASKIMLINGLSVVLHSLVTVAAIVVATTSQLQRPLQQQLLTPNVVTYPVARGADNAHNLSPTTQQTVTTNAATMMTLSGSSATMTLVTKLLLANGNPEGGGGGSDNDSRRQHPPSLSLVNQSQSELELNKSSDSLRLTEQQSLLLQSQFLQSDLQPDGSHFAQTSSLQQQPSRQILLEKKQVPNTTYSDDNGRTLSIQRAQEAPPMSSNLSPTHHAESSTTAASSGQQVQQALKRYHNQHHHHHTRHIQSQQQLEMASDLAAAGPSTFEDIPSSLSTSTINEEVASSSSGFRQVDSTSTISSAAMPESLAASVTGYATATYNGAIASEASTNSTEDCLTFSHPTYEAKIILCILYSLLAFAAIASNMIVCYIVLSNRRMRTATNYFIVNLAVGDILMAFLCIPLTVGSNVIVNHWPFGLSLCIIVSSAQVVSIFISAYTMVAISIDKYLAIMYPMRLRMPKTQAKIIILAIWSLALLTSIPAALLSSLVPSNSTINASKLSYSDQTPVATTIDPSLYQATAAELSLSSRNLLQETLPFQPNNSTLSNGTIFKQQPRFLDNDNNYYYSGNSEENSQLNKVVIDEEEPFAKALPTARTVATTLAPKQSNCQMPDHVLCIENWDMVWKGGQFYYSLALMTLEFVLPLFVLVITYSRIVIVVWGKRMPGEEDNARDARMARSKRKMIKMVIFCVIAFALTWFPLNALQIYTDLHTEFYEIHPEEGAYIQISAHYLFMCHTITNPLIYIWMNTRFRAGFKQVIGDLWRPIGRLLFYSWCYCCLLGCCLGCSRQKYRRVAANTNRKRSHGYLTSTGSMKLNSNHHAGQNNTNTATSRSQLGAYQAGANNNSLQTGSATLNGTTTQNNSNNNNSSLGSANISAGTPAAAAAPAEASAATASGPLAPNMTGQARAPHNGDQQRSGAAGLSSRATNPTKSNGYGSSAARRPETTGGASAEPIGPIGGASGASRPSVQAGSPRRETDGANRLRGPGQQQAAAASKGPAHHPTRRSECSFVGYSGGGGGERELRGELSGARRACCSSEREQRHQRRAYCEPSRELKRRRRRAQQQQQQQSHMIGVQMTSTEFSSSWEASGAACDGDGTDGGARSAKPPATRASHKVIRKGRLKSNQRLACCAECSPEHAGRLGGQAAGNKRGKQQRKEKLRTATNESSNCSETFAANKNQSTATAISAGPNTNTSLAISSLASPFEWSSAAKSIASAGCVSKDYHLGNDDNGGAEASARRQRLQHCLEQQHRQRLGGGRLGPDDEGLANKATTMTKTAAAPAGEGLPRSIDKLVARVGTETSPLGSAELRADFRRPPQASELDNSGRGGAPGFLGGGLNRHSTSLSSCGSINSSSSEQATSDLSPVANNNNKTEDDDDQEVRGRPAGVYCGELGERESASPVLADEFRVGRQVLETGEKVCDVFIIQQTIPNGFLARRAPAKDGQAASLGASCGQFDEDYGNKSDHDALTTLETEFASDEQAPLVGCK